MTKKTKKPSKSSKSSKRSKSSVAEHFTSSSEQRTTNSKQPTIHRRKKVALSTPEGDTAAALFVAAGNTKVAVALSTAAQHKEHELSEITGTTKVVDLVTSRPRLLHLLSWCALQIQTIVRPSYETHPDVATREKFFALLNELESILDKEYRPI